MVHQCCHNVSTIASRHCPCARNFPQDQIPDCTSIAWTNRSALQLEDMLLSCQTKDKFKGQSVIKMLACHKKVTRLLTQKTPTTMAPTVFPTGCCLQMIWKSLWRIWLESETAMANQDVATRMPDWLKVRTLRQKLTWWFSWTEDLEEVEEVNSFTYFSGFASILRWNCGNSLIWSNSVTGLVTVIPPNAIWRRGVVNDWNHQPTSTGAGQEHCCKGNPKWWQWLCFI